MAARLWAFGQMGASRLAFARLPEARFWKLCGSGTGEGFTPRPNTGVWAILAVWDDEATARTKVETAPVFCRWRACSVESWTVFLAPVSARGKWSGCEPFLPSRVPVSGPVAALTRATINPRILRRFWGRVPKISAMIGANPDVIFKIGIGEVPLLHQVTFSIWPDVQAMAEFARGSGAHGEAIQAVRREGWFREELYARFSVLGDSGTWDGRRPLEQHVPAT